MNSSSLPIRQRPDRVKPPQSHSNHDRKSSSTSNKLKSTAPGSDSEDDDQVFHDARFTPDHEAELLKESHELKATANAQFGRSDFSQAISTYERALASCPNYLDYEIAVLQSNMAACHSRLEEWKDAIEAADRSLDALDREDPPPKPKKEKRAKKKKSASTSRFDRSHPPTGPPDASDSSDSDESLEQTHTTNPTTPSTSGPPPAVVELPSSDSESEAEPSSTTTATTTNPKPNSTATALHNLALSDQRHQDISRIRTKSLLRRARARMELGRKLAHEGKGMLSSPSGSTAGDDKSSAGGSPWTLLSGALADYQTLLPPPTDPNSNASRGPSTSSTHLSSSLPPSDLKSIRTALAQLPAEIDAAKQRETAEMMGKLKELGNGILKPFGLSTDMFKFVQDEKTGGYSVNFEQGGGKKG